MARIAFNSLRCTGGGTFLINELFTMLNVFKKRHPSVARIFSQAKHNRHILLVAIDYAKASHFVLFINGDGDELRQPFEVHNNADGLAFLQEAIVRTCKKRRIRRSHIFLGGEGLPSYARNFILRLSDNGFLILNIHAKKAKEMRQTEQASTDKLDLIGIAKCMLHGSGTPIGPKRLESIPEPHVSPHTIDTRAKAYTDLFADQEALQVLTRSRGSLVYERTGCTNRIHTFIDQLFPGFLSSACPLTPFLRASRELMLLPDFSAQYIAQQQPDILAPKLKSWGTHHPEASAKKLIALAKTSLASSPPRQASLQIVLQSHVTHYQGLAAGISMIDAEIERRLTTSPASLLLSIPGIGMVLAASIYAELGSALIHRPLKELCSYAGIIPRVKQSGGSKKPTKSGKVRKGCNLILKNYLVQAAAKMRDWGPEGLKDAYAQLQGNGQHADFIIARRLLRIFKFMMIHQTIYLPPTLREWGRDHDTRDSLVIYLSEIKHKIFVKWVRHTQARVALTTPNPLGLWWQTMDDALQQIHSLKLA